MSVFVKYCDPDFLLDSTTIDISGEILDGDPDFIEKVCNEIGFFSKTVIEEMNKILSVTIKNRISSGNPPTDNTYKTNNVFCRDENQCKKIYRFQHRQKNFIPQITHIVQEFGLFLPLGVNSLQYIPNIVEKVESMCETVKRTKNLKKMPTSQLGKRITGKNGKIFGMEIKTFLEEKITNFDHITFVELLQDYVILEFQPYYFGKKSDEFQEWLYKFNGRLSTVLRLRYIDMYTCNSMRINMNNSNRQHSETYMAFLKLKKNFIEMIHDINNSRSKNRFIGGIYDIPKNDNFGPNIYEYTYTHV